MLTIENNVRNLLADNLSTAYIQAVLYGKFSANYSIDYIYKEIEKQRSAVKKQIKNPEGKRKYTVHIRTDLGVVAYKWDTVYHVYNSVENYEQLKNWQLDYLVWEIK